MKRAATTREKKPSKKSAKRGESTQATLMQFVLGAGIAALEEMFEKDRELLCGERYRHVSERTAYRAGYTTGKLALSGRQVHLQRPRVRGKEGCEVPLPSWQAFADTDPLDARAYEQLVVGVSTRKYDRSLEPVSDSVQTSGTSKSAVSRRFIEATEERLRQLTHRPLNTMNVLVLMLDGIRMGEHLLLVALGIDEQGNKHVLGLQEGATENSASCTRLLTNLRDRGLGLQSRGLLVVIDGAKALSKSVREVYGSLALIQRCQEHKKRNVQDHLPESMKEAIRARMNAAYSSRRAAWAERELRSLADELMRVHPGAAASLLEGLDETLTLMRLNVSQELTRSLSTTNLIENLMGAIRRLTRNVDRWQGGQMALRWAATALLEAEPRFSPLRTARHLGLLRLALQAHYAALTQQVDNKNVAA